MLAGVAAEKMNVTFRCFEQVPKCSLFVIQASTEVGSSVCSMCSV
jgi:hypothetical protein